jgi:transcriptional regulator with XRE-family HTH domain
MLAMTEPVKIGQHVAVARKQAGLSQYALAHRVGVSATYIQKLERGEIETPAIDKLRRMADVLGVPVAYFVTEESAQLAEERARYEFNRDPALDAFTASVTDLVPNATLDAVVGVVREVAKIPPEYHREVLEGAAAYVSVTARRLRARGIRLLGEPD